MNTPGIPILGLAAFLAGSPLFAASYTWDGTLVIELVNDFSPVACDVFDVFNKSDAARRFLKIEVTLSP